MPSSSNKGLSGKVVYLIRTYFLNNIHNGKRINKIAVMKYYSIRYMLRVSIVNLCLPTHHSMYFVILIKQNLCKIRPILTRYSGD